MLPRQSERRASPVRESASGSLASDDSEPGELGFGECIHGLFEAQAERTPEAVAVVFEKTRLTYRDLNARANQLAHHLRHLGVGPDMLVGICLARTERMLIAILAVLKAGGAYVPLDPAYPKERTDFILQDAKAPVLIAERAAGAIDPPQGTQVLFLDPGWEETITSNSANPVSGASETDLAYVIYTSGSTGQPKGVALEHRNTAALITWARDIYAPAELAGVLASTSICFDLSVFEMFVPLCAGGAVILVENALALPGLADRVEVTLVNTVPSAIRELVRIHGVPSSVRVVNLAGEPLTAALADEIYATTSVEKVCDLYGPSETTTYSTFALRMPGQPATIGRPLANEKILLLDPERRPVPSGDIGEMYIGGAGVGRGYLNRPELTAERFVPDPFEPGGRLYKTGDLARWSPDGNLEFLGRIDFQVKIRGFRIELGEIETVLRLHPGVQDVAVIAREDTAEDIRIVAYVVGPATPDELRQFLRRKLPAHMMPSAFVTLGALPLTANGKLDRKALPVPDYSTFAAQDYVAPRTTLEKTLAHAWQDILSIQKVGVLDNFFELGGHSLFAIRMVSRLREELSVALPLRAIFEHQTIESLATYIGTIRAGEGQGTPLIPSISPVPRDNAPPLSFAQQRLWFLDQLAPGSSAYNIPQAFRLSGLLNIAALESAIREIVNRHEALRTVFALQGDSPVQVILPQSTFTLTQTDLRFLSASAREEEAARLAREESFRPFDLQRGPLLRASLLCLDTDEHILFLNIHHIVSDGWSMGVFARELSALYDAFSHDLPSPLPALPVQYSDFAIWQRQWLSGDTLDRQLAYWKNELTGAPVSIALPADRPSPRDRTFHAAEVRFALPATLTRELNATSHHAGATLFMTLLAAFQVLLHRLSGQDDIVVGTALAGRNQAETEALIGFFVNSLPLRVSLAGDPTFLGLLALVRESTLGMFAHQDIPFEQIVQALNPARNTSHSPLFNVMFTMDDGMDAKTSLTGLRTVPFRADCVAAKFDLTLTLAETDGQLEGWFVYDTDLFDAVTIERMSGHYRQLLESIAAAPGASISTLQLLTEQERKSIADWNTTTADYPAAETVHALFAAQVRRTPLATALVHGSTRLSYSDLDIRSSHLALCLRASGVRDGSLVTVCMERSVDMIVALLAVLKAGAAYVPLDPPFPEERLAMILGETRSPVLLTQKKLAANLPGTSAEILLVDEEDPSQLPAQSFSNSTTGESPAYVIYTSGSSGTPKGVIIPHRAINRLVINTDYAQLTPTDVVAQAATCAFDAATFEIWGALLNGAQLVIIDKDTLLSARDFAAEVQRHGITTLFLTTALFNHLAKENAAVFKPLKHLLFGGEACDPDVIRAVLDAGPPTRLLHVYGPTETTTFATWYPVTIVPADATTVPIGRPIANTKAYLLDPDLNPVPVGVSGEIHIGGPGLGAGYLDRPELTAEKFIPSPFDPDTRLYKTGDLARWRADGNIEFLGRIDFQVKIRGFRIELGEIESVLRLHPGVNDVAVIAHASSTEDKRLVAYIVGEATASDLRQFLKTKLPDYMTPAAFVHLGALPLTANGKLDRKALPTPDYSSFSSQDHLALRTPLEHTIAKIWCQILGIASIGANANFFELGGHSLLAIRLISSLRDALEIELPLRRIFEHQTLESLAAHIETIQSAAGQGTQLLPPIHATQHGDRPPVSFAQQRLWFLDQLAPGSSAYNIPQAFRLRGELNPAPLESALAEIARRHESLRTVFAYENDSPVQVILAEATFALPLVDLSASPESSREDDLLRLAREEAFRPFDLKTGPLFRATLLRLAPAEHVLLLTLHHIVSDGWSMGILARELSALYAAFVNGHPSPLPDIPIQYADFALWQRQWLQGDLLDAQLRYWKHQLRGDLPLLKLPTDFPRPATQTDIAGDRTLLLSKPLSERLRSLSQQEGVTLFMLLLAAFDALLFRLTGGEDIIVGSPIAGRNSPETEGLIGFFVNTLVLRTDLSGDPAFRDLLTRVREVTLGAYTHQDLPFEKLVEELNPERRLGHTPIFQVMLNMLSVDTDPIDLDGFKVEVIPSGQFKSKFDLTLYVTDKAGGIELNLVFNSSIFAASRMTEMLAQFEHLLTQITAAPDIRLSAIGLVTDSAKPLLPDPIAPLPIVDFIALPQHFSDVASRNSTKTAIADPNGSWTYAALDATTNQLAHALRSRGIKQGDVVAIWANRDASLAVAMLSVWKAGAAFVILDPAYPEPRLEEMVNIADPKAWLDTAGAPPLPPSLRDFATILPCRLKVPAIPEDPSTESSRAQFAQPLDIQLAPIDLAYIAFTSGSRGLPKAIAGSHAPISHFLDWHCRHFNLAESDRFSVLAGLGHDPLIRDIFAPLWIGATVCFPDADLFEQPDRFRAWMRDEAITVSHLTPSMAAILTQTLAPGSLPALRHLFLGGDILRTDIVQSLRAAAPAARCVNFYGATETPQAIAFHEIPADQPTPLDNATPLPIGRGIDAVQLLILTKSGQLAGVGETGEIHVRTPYLATGYLGYPAQTSAKFTPNPFTRDLADKLYKTGDLARYLPDGAVDFLGRADDQIKLRGFRIEPAEVEGALLTHPAIHQAAIVAGQGIDGDKRLIAYIAPAASTLDPAALREFLRRQLPDYMIPSAFVFLDALPLLSSGKIDAKSLPPPDHSRPSLEKVFMAPRDELELRLSRIWQDVLGIQEIGVRDDFFDLGGHSLLGVRLLARIEKIFDKRLPLSAIFEARNIEQLAAVLRKEGWSSSWYSLIPIQPCGSRPPLFGIHDLHFKDLAARLGQEQPIYGLRYGLAGHTRDGVAILPARIEDLAAHYIQEMRALQPHGPYHLMGLSFGGVVAFEMAQQLHAQQQEVALLALFDSYLTATSHQLPFSAVAKNILKLGPAPVIDRIKARATRIRTKFSKGAYQPHVHHPWGVQRDLADAYIPKTYPGGILLFKAAQPMPTVFQVYDPPELAWRKWVTGPCEVHEIHAGHIEILEEPHIQQVAAILAQRLL